MKSSDERFKGLENVYLIKSDGIVIFQQNLFCEQSIKNNQQFVDKLISLHYKQEVIAKWKDT